MHLIDQSIIFVYFFANILIGLWFAVKRRGSADEFISAKNSMSGWVLGLSMVVTYLSSIGFIAVTGNSFSRNWAAFAVEIPIVLTLYLAVRYFIPFYRREGDVSSFSHLGRRFGPWATVYALLMHGITAVIRMGIMLFLVSKALSYVTGWNELNIILMVGLVTTLYTCSGGLKSVIWTDVLQFALMLGGTIGAFVYLVCNTPDGFWGFVRVANEYEKFSLGDFSLDFATPTFWVFLLAGMSLNLYWYSLSPAYVQRYVAARTTGEAKKAIIWSTVSYILLVSLFFVIGTALFVYYKTHPGLLPESISYEDGDSVYAYFVANGLPVGLKGVMIAAILAAAMSSVDSSVNSLSMLYLVNVHRPYINPHPGKKSSMRLLYSASIIVGLLAMVIAILFRKQTSVLDSWYLLSSLFMGGALGLFVMGMVSKTAKKPAGVLGVIAGTLVVLWAFFSPQLTGAWANLANPFHAFMTFTLSNLVILMVGLAWTRFGTKPE